MPDLKETRFFARELHPEPPRAGRGEAGVHPSTFENYLSLFAAAAPGQRTGEASPSYLRSQLAPQRIAELRPDARIIAIFREPASFLRSLHLQLLQAHVERRRIWRGRLRLSEPRRERARPRRADPPGLMYSEHVQYVEQLRRYHAVFPPSRCWC